MPSSKSEVKYLSALLLASLSPRIDDGLWASSSGGERVNIRKLDFKTTGASFVPNLPTKSFYSTMQYPLGH